MFVFDLFLALFRIAWWPSARNELFACVCHLCSFIPDALLGVHFMYYGRFPLPIRSTRSSPIKRRQECRRGLPCSASLRLPTRKFWTCPKIWVEIEKPSAREAIGKWSGIGWVEVELIWKRFYLFIYFFLRSCRDLVWSGSKNKNTDQYPINSIPIRPIPHNPCTTRSICSGRDWVEIDRGRVGRAEIV